MNTEEKIQLVKHIHGNILAKEISCNIGEEIKRYELEHAPYRDQLVAELLAEGVKIKLNYSSTLFNGGPAIEVLEA